MDETGFDWSSLKETPLFLLLPVTVGCTLVVWTVTEALGFIVPSKHRAGVALLLGPLTGWSVNRLELLDFGWGPEGWGRSLFFGVLAGVLAVLGHNKIKTIPPFSWLAAQTPGSSVVVKVPKP